MGMMEWEFGPLGAGRTEWVWGGRRLEGMSEGRLEERWAAEWAAQSAGPWEAQWARPWAASLGRAKAQSARA